MSFININKASEVVSRNIDLNKTIGVNQVLDPNQEIVIDMIELSKS